MKTILNIKTDKSLKEEAQQVAAELGIPLSTVMNSFLRRFVRDREVTFSTDKYRMTPYLEKVVKEARAEYEAGKTSGPFESADELIKHLDL
jgi:addiction module RelB/DinJ family antitoxin